MTAASAPPSDSSGVAGSEATTEQAAEEELRALETGALDLANFPHSEHVRLGYEMLGRYGFGDAVSRFARGLKLLAAKAGKPQVYHETITVAFLALINERTPAARLEDGANSKPLIRICSTSVVWKNGTAPSSLPRSWRGRRFVCPAQSANLLIHECSRPGNGRTRRRRLDGTPEFFPLTSSGRAFLPCNHMATKPASAYWRSSRLSQPCSSCFDERVSSGWEFSLRFLRWQP